VKRIEYDLRANWKLIFENLFGVLSLSRGASCALEKLTPYDSAEKRPVRRTFSLGGFYADHKRQQFDDERQCLRALGPWATFRADDHHRVFYYFPFFPNMLLSMPPGTTSWCISSGRSLRNGRSSFVIGFFSSGGVRSRRFSSERRRRILGYDQSAGLARMRVKPSKALPPRAYRPGPYSPPGNYFQRDGIESTCVTWSEVESRILEFRTFDIQGPRRSMCA